MANQTKVTTYKTGQYVTTIPKALAQAARLKKGDTVEWLIQNGDIVMRKV